MTDNKDYQGKDETSLPEEEDLDFDPWANKPWKYWSEEEWGFQHWMSDVIEVADQDNQWEFLFLVKNEAVFTPKATREQFEALIEAKAIGEIQFKDGKGQPIQILDNLICELIYGDDIALFVARKKIPDPEPQNQE
jgi:hypothetical protein